jgi:hypothetical protein
MCRLSGRTLTNFRIFQDEEPSHRQQPPPDCCGLRERFFRDGANLKGAARKHAAVSNCVESGLRSRRFAAPMVALLRFQD